eukprot:scaffold47039_cov54-Phaeocystis_antarctica.AAC.4
MPLAPPPHTPSCASRLAPRPASHALLSTRQTAYAFNQPLSFDTSSVTNMRYMFYVRSARALPPICSRALSCTLLAPPSPAASVTDMYALFYVRSARALAPSL